MFKTLIGVALVIIVPGPAFAQAMPAPAYVAKAGASDLFERQSGKVMAASHNAGVRQYATMMIRDHTKSTADVKAAAGQDRVAVGTPMMSTMQASDLAALKRARGNARDQLYIAQQKTAHQDALMLQQNYAAAGDAPALRTVAAAIVPVVQHHIEMLDRM